MDTGYHIPSASLMVETSIKKSQFITHIGHATSRFEAEAMIRALRLQHPQATHVCWAYIAGAPNTTVMSMSDDGEPSGTAGRPMLNALQHSGLGEIVVAIVRYFGGTKLGTGGLQRAYSGCVKDALAILTTHEKVAQQPFKLQSPYALEAMIRHLIDHHHAMLLQCNYDQALQLEGTIALANYELFKAELINRSSGVIQVVCTD